jgi:hypothetical protein
MAEGEGYEPFSRERKLVYKASLATQLVHPPRKTDWLCRKSKPIQVKLA